MAQIIRSISDLRLSFQRRASLAAKMTRDEMFKIFQKHINKYYAEYSPTVYERTYKFLNSLIKTEVVVEGSSIYCSVRIDEDYLNYEYPYTGKFNPSYPHHYDGRFASGYDVASWANWQFPYDDAPGKNHGYTRGTKTGGFWDESIQELGGEQGILALMKQNLIKCGVPVL